MPNKATGELLDEAQKVLSDNWVELESGTGFSKPAARVYPYQWNWDSGFSAIGYAHFDIKRAQQELRALFFGQWENGMLPHIIFHTESLDYFPDQSFWQANERNPDAPETPQTSGMTQPPVQAIAAWRIYEQLLHTDEATAREWLEEMYPQLLQLHEYFYNVRDREKNGLITIYHPWESGMDNSPRWDEALESIVIEGENSYTRQDTNFVDQRFRPSDASYDKYIFLADSLRRLNYNEAEIRATHPFQVKDILLSSILHLATGYLERMAKVLNKDTEVICGWRERFANGLGRAENEASGLFYDLDIKKDKLLKANTVACIAPIISGELSKAQTEDLFTALNEVNFCGSETCHTSLLPSVGISQPTFDPQAYWRGPIWININWLIWLGLKNAGHEEHAQTLQNNLISLLQEHGIWEYYSPEDYAGIGAERFSWSAALAIDILKSD